MATLEVLSPAAVMTGNAVPLAARVPTTPSRSVGLGTSRLEREIAGSGRLRGLPAHRL